MSELQRTDSELEFTDESGAAIHWIRQVGRTTWVVAGIVVVGVWNAQTDHWPISDGVRPSWYVYGWPVCFGTSGRGRFNWVSYDARALLFDLVVSAAIIAGTIMTTEILNRVIPRVALRSMLAIVGGASFVFAVWSGRLNWFLFLVLKASLPGATVSATAGNIQPAHRLSPFVTFPLTVGLFCAGFATVELAFRMLIRLQRASSTK
jgi:hypothetical protein